MSCLPLVGSVKPPKVEDILRVLNSYAGRDKVLRTACFSLILLSTKSKNAEFASALQTLAKQISQCRTVCRQLSHLPLIVAVQRLHAVFLKATDKFEASANLFVTVAYLFYQSFELASWLGEAKVVNLNPRRWIRLALYCWVAALAVGMTQILRRIYVLEPAEDRREVADEKRLEARRMDRITLIGMAADFIGGVNLLPDRVLWAGRLNARASASAFLVASVIGLYKCF